MKHSRRRFVVLLVLAVLPLAACGESAAEAAAAAPPVTVEQIEGSELSTVTLSTEAAERLGIETVAVSQKQLGGAARTVVPFAALLYDANGRTWVYTQTKDLVFVRSAVSVDQIEGDEALLSDGPPAGTLVVTTGAAELLGAEYGVGEPE